VHARYPVRRAIRVRPSTDTNRAKHQGS
jgi:hypothetical protein